MVCRDRLAEPRVELDERRGIEVTLVQTRARVVGTDGCQVDLHRRQSLANLGETRGGTISTGTWQHVCFVYEPTGQSVWIGGKRVANDATPFAKITLTTDELRIGARADGTNTYAGVVDDVRIYARALSDTEIDALAQP